MKGKPQIVSSCECQQKIQWTSSEKKYNQGATTIKK